MATPPPLPSLLPVADLLRGRLAAAGIAAAVGVGLLAFGDDPYAGATCLAVAAIAALTHRGVAGSGPGSPAAHFALLLSDLVGLTVILAATGGPSNPLAVAYLIATAVAALLLPPRLVWATTALGVAAYGSLFVLAPRPPDHHMGMGAHYLGMFLAHVAASPVVALALLHARRTTAAAQRAARDARQLQARTERLAALGTLAAGASHELASPLSTILVVAHELQRRSPDPDTSEDLALIRAEVERCQTLLHQLAADAGQGMGEAATPTALAALLDAAARDHEPVQVEAMAGAVTVPRRLTIQALRRLLGNARRASGPDQPITLRGQVDDGALVCTIEDHGVGMSPAVLERAAEPFFTTRPEGQGTGLGLYFVHTVATHLGGSLTLRSEPGRGTTATLRLPVGGPAPETP